MVTDSDYVSQLFYFCDYLFLLGVYWLFLIDKSYKMDHIFEYEEQKNEGAYL